jgi:hypothetical protein
MAAGMALGLALAALGCVEEDEEGTDGGADATDLAAPTIALGNVAAYQGVSGAFAVEVTAADDVGVTLVELLVDGAVAASSTAAPFTVTWDTTAAADGIVTIAARASDASGKTAETPAFAVVVINGGAEVSFTDGETGQISIPAAYDGTQEIDVRRHWTAANAAARVLLIVSFTPAEGQADWNVGLKMGAGYCPDDGTTYDSTIVYGVTAEPVVFDSVPDAAYPGSTQLFLHFATSNPTEHLGESLPFALKAFSFQ